MCVGFNGRCFNFLFLRPLLIALHFFYKNNKIKRKKIYRPITFVIIEGDGMNTIQIRVPEKILKKVDEIIRQGVFRSRSQLLREALTKFIAEMDQIGVIPYIVGPFTPEQIESLKHNPKQELGISTPDLEKINKELKNLKL